MRRLVVGLVACVLPAGAASAQSAEDFVVKPQWAGRPTTYDMSRNYPKEAAKAGTGGRATIACVVDDKGGLGDCRAVAEEPALGFGAAAMAVAPRFKMKPLDGDGRPVAGRPVRIPFRFVPPPVFVEMPEGWDALQTWDEWTPHYPKAALAAGLAGEAVMTCQGGKGEKKASCWIESESPEGQGFGKAALAMRAKIYMKPPPGGAPDARVSMKVVFRPTPQAR